MLSTALQRLSTKVDYLGREQLSIRYGCFLIRKDLVESELVLRYHISELPSRVCGECSFWAFLFLSWLAGFQCMLGARLKESYDEEARTYLRNTKKGHS